MRQAVAGKHAIGWRYEADAELGGTVYELPEQLGPGLERHGWTQPTDSGDERAVVDPDAIGSSSYDKDPDLPAADAQRATALEELRSVGLTPRFATGEYHECGGNKGLWPVDGAKWSYVVSMRLDPPRAFVETRQLTGVRAGLHRLGWKVSGAANSVVVQARKGDLTLEVRSKYGMAYRDDYVAGGRP